MQGFNSEMKRRVIHPWEAAYPPGIRWDAPIEICTIPELLDRSALRWTDRPALAYRGQRITYGALAEHVDRLAAGLLRSGLQAGDAVALYLPNTPFHPICFFALARAGIKVVHLSALDTRRDLAHKMQDSGARTLITTDLAGLVENALGLLESKAADLVLVGEDSLWGGTATEADLPSSGPTPWSDQFRKLTDLMQQSPHRPWPSLSVDDIALLQYTGGTTGMPKGAVLTHANMTAAASMYRLWGDDGVDGEGLRRGQERVLGVLPLFHIYALTTVLLRHISEGNEILLRPRFDVSTTLDDIHHERVSVFPGVPTMWIGLLNHPASKRRDFSSLRDCMSGGAPLPFDVEQRVGQMLGRRLRGGWGMTETCPAGTLVPTSAEPRPGLIGVPLPGIEMRIVALDDPGREMPTGELGEICIRGPNVFSAYWNQPEASAKSFHDGFFLSGDIGRIDPDGVFVITDRKKDMIISSGFNVYPAMIENAIYEHEDVEEAIVIGIPDAYRGQAAKAFIKLRAGAAGLTLADLCVFLGERIGRHEMPAALEIRTALPRSAAGKLLASVLTAEEQHKAEADQAALPAASHKEPV